MQRSVVLSTLLRREIYRFVRLMSQTVAPPLITTLLFILIFGFSLGSRIREIAGWPYILYILPGLAAQGIITNAYANTATSVYAARFDHSIENLLTSPISPLQFVISLITGGVVRATLIGMLTLAIGVIAVDLPLHSPALALLWIVMISVTFACVGIVSGLRAQGWDNLQTMTNFVMTPGIYLGGVFYSITFLPEPWQTISLFNPFFYCVDGIRFTVLGTTDIPFIRSFVVMSITMLGMVVLCWELLRRGYRLVK
jgi:ABC-2 type transport system permease protein